MPNSIYKKPYFGTLRISYNNLVPKWFFEDAQKYLPIPGVCISIR